MLYCFFKLIIVHKNMQSSAYWCNQILLFFISQTFYTALSQFCKQYLYKCGLNTVEDRFCSFSMPTILHVYLNYKQRVLKIVDLLATYIKHYNQDLDNNQAPGLLIKANNPEMQAKKTSNQIEDDIKNNKVKEGVLVKQSRFLKQWKQRYMVLTRTHLYSFEKKGVYKDATEIIPLQKTLTVKSYYKMQYDKPHIFRIQTPDIHLYLSPKSSQEKWAWMTAIEKMLNRVFVPQQKSDSHAMIRQTLKMRETMVNSTTRSQSQNEKQIIKVEIEKVIDKLKLGLTGQTVNILLQSPRKKGDIEKQKTLQMNFNQLKQVYGGQKVQQKTQSKPEKAQVQKIIERQRIVHIPVQRQKVVQKMVQKVVDKVVYVPQVRQKIVEKVVYVPQVKQKIVEKVVYVPQVRQKIVEKVIYKDSNSSANKSYLQAIFRDLIDSKVQNPKPMVDFIVFLVSSRLQQYTQTIISFLLSPDIQRFFAEIFLHLLNQQTDQQNLNSYFQFATVLYEHCDQYFYSSDVRVLIDIVLKEMELNRSEFNQFLLMSFLRKLTSKQWWSKITHRKDQIKMMVKELQSISNIENQLLAKQLQANL